jgi:hypothetical protein
MTQSEQEQKNCATPKPENKTTVKKPYQKPEVRFERVFETMALRCGKQAARGSGCRYNRKSS